MRQNKTKYPMHSEKLFNDRWIALIGIPLIGISFPLLFGLRPGHSFFWVWIVLSTIITSISWIGTRWFGILLWNQFPWEKKPLLHIVIVGALIFFSFVFILVVFLLNQVIEGASEHYWQTHQTLNLAILLVFLFIVIVHELAYLFFSWKKELIRSSQLEKAHMQAKFDALKSQVNPHFLFNSLGTLSAIIETDPQKAIHYVNEFSNIYRYILNVNNTDFVPLSEELEFIDSYLYLQHIRYGEQFQWINRLNKKLYSTYILPLTLQLLIENALKHNILSEKTPLLIEATADERNEYIQVRNNLQLRELGNSPRMGLKNLEERYRDFTGQTIRYGLEEAFFIVEIPIISGTK